MGTETHSYRRTWALALATARAVLALACLVFQLFLAPVDFAWFTLAIVLFAASSLFALRRSERLAEAQTSAIEQSDEPLPQASWQSRFGLCDCPGAFR